MSVICTAVNMTLNKSTLNWKIESGDFVGNVCLAQTTSLDNGIKVLIYETRHQCLDTNNINFLVYIYNTYSFEIQGKNHSTKNDIIPVKSAISFATINAAKEQAELFLESMGCL